MSFERAVTHVLLHEGGYSNDPNDPGGETQYGISKRAYPNEDIKGMTLARAKELYRRDYWDRLKLDAREEAAAFVIFDCAVNQGVARARQILDRVPPGPNFVAHYQAERALHYAGLPTFTRYGRGWMRRLIATAMEAER